MGIVYEAFDRDRDARVALKFLPNVNPTALYRFKQEFRTLADVSHPHLVALYELFSDHEQWFFTMELVDGVDLLTYVRGPPSTGRSAQTTGPTLSMPTEERAGGGMFGADPGQTKFFQAETVSPENVGLTERQVDRLRLALRQLVAGVERLHRSGILHRDIKPSNVLVTREGRLVLLDFGLAAELRSTHDALSGGSEGAGTAAYM